MKVKVCPADAVSSFLAAKLITYDPIGPQVASWMQLSAENGVGGLMATCQGYQMVTVDVKTSDELIFSLGDASDTATLASLFSLGFMIVICPWLLGFFVKQIRKVLFSATGHDE